VTTFLAAPSRALFAASLDGSSNITGDNDWEVLDFGDIEKGLAQRLSDDDISAVLKYIDAVHNVKKLKLTNCTNLTGVGLGPLRGSIIIQQIDLSLVGKHQSPEIDPEPPISCEAVLPILNSIISQDRCVLKHLQFPYKWQRAEEQQQFVTFLTRYNQMLRSRGDVHCLRCNENLPRHGQQWIYTNGRQNYTCYECLKNYCDECEDDDDGDVLLLPCCQECGRMYCQQCERMNCCGINDYECRKYFCVDCVEAKECAVCTSSACKQCVVSKDAGIECFGGCGRYLCRDCLDYNMDLSHWRRDCECCGKSFCPDCESERRGRIEGVVVPCRGCVQLGHPVLAKEIKQLKSEVKDLKEQIEKMKSET
jgi:hypothetical protein